MNAGTKAWRSRAKLIRTERAPRGETLIMKAWCESCRRMHDHGACPCRHDFRDGDICSKCDQMKETR